LGENEMKKILAVFLTVITLFSMMTFVVSAAGNSIKDATSIEFDTTYNGTINETNKKDVYKFTLPTSGRINIKATAYIYRTHYFLYDVNGNVLWEAKYCTWNGTTEVFNLNETFHLTTGEYYFAVERCDGDGDYNLAVSFVSANETFQETPGGINNSVATASPISIGQEYYGQIAKNDAKDIYKFTIPTSGTVNIKLTAYIYRTHYYIYDSNGYTIWESKYQTWNGTSEEYNKFENVCLTSGDYYFAIERCEGDGNYNFILTFTSSNESFQETLGGINNTVTTASPISLGTVYFGQISHNDYKDIYEFTIVTSGEYTFNINAYIYRTNYYIYNEKGDTVWKQEYQTWNSNTQLLEKNEKINLEPGIYYFAVTHREGFGDYNFSITAPGETVPPVIIPGTDEPLLGDVNNDGNVTAVDARVVLQHVAGLREIEEENQKLVDLNEDGQITAIDARIILQMVAGLR
jgi:hypothetical protein